MMVKSDSFSIPRRMKCLWYASVSPRQNKIAAKNSGQESVIYTLVKTYIKKHFLNVTNLVTFPH